METEWNRIRTYLFMVMITKAVRRQVLRKASVNTHVEAIPSGWKRSLKLSLG